MWKFTITFLLMMSSTGVYSASNPDRSRFDNRIQSQIYNAQDVTSIYTKDGYSSVIVLADDERVITKHAGFADGWDIVNTENLILIKPIAVEQAGDDGSKYIFEPTPKEWDTNLFISTTKRNYSFDLILGVSTSTPAYQVNFKYPQDIAKKRKIEQEKQLQEVENKSIDNSLKAIKTPKNWDYFMKVKLGSETIAPDYAYDDGIFTYLGFNVDKTFPAVFLLDGVSETLLNTHVQQNGNYQVLVVQKTSEKLILRSGDHVVGIFNQSYGKVPTSYNTTISPNISRITK